MKRRIYIVLTLIAACVIAAGCATLYGTHADNEARLLFCGDVMLDWGIRDVCAKEGYAYPLKKISGFLSSFDYCFCNLECPVSSTGEPHIDKKYIFLAEPESVEVLVRGSIRGVSLANNHMLDFGMDAMLNTAAILAKNGIRSTGAGLDYDDAHLPVLAVINSSRIAISAYTNIGYADTYATRTSPGLAMASADAIRKDIQRLRNYNDIIIIVLHWGDEYSDYPTQGQIDLAHAVIDSGADAVIGHHSHVYQGVEIYRKKPIFYSLGNFLFGSTNENGRDNIVAALWIKGGRLASLTVYAVNGNKDAASRFQPRLMSGNDADTLLRHLIDISRPLGSDFPKNAVIADGSCVYEFITPAIDSTPHEK